MRVSKADGSQVLDLQRDALLTVGVAECNIYSDTASGKKDDPPASWCLASSRHSQSSNANSSRNGRWLGSPQHALVGGAVVANQR